jgi:hypothetical protein
VEGSGGVIVDESSGKQMTQTNYRVIGYGRNEHGFFNEPAFCSTIGYAKGIYNAHISDPEMDGAMIIEVKHEEWKVIQEFFVYPVSVVYGPLGTFRVERAPELEMV